MAEELVQNALLVALMLSGVPLLAIVATGFVVAVLQSLTQINEQTLSFVPKICAVGGVFVFLGPWMWQLLSRFVALSFEKVTLVAQGLQF